jgi:spore coat polysaccharide biosynthesis protein SpsF (cytidylyltransferase family)
MMRRRSVGEIGGVVRTHLRRSVDYARDKGIPLGVNVESVSIRNTEIEASVELLQLLRQRIDSSAR